MTGSATIILGRPPHGSGLPVGLVVSEHPVARHQRDNRLHSSDSDCDSVPLYLNKMPFRTIVSRESGDPPTILTHENACGRAVRSQSVDSNAERPTLGLLAWKDGHQPDMNGNCQSEHHPRSRFLVGQQHATPLNVQRDGSPERLETIAAD